MICGTPYRAKFRGVAYANKIMELCRDENHGTLRRRELSKILFRDVLVSPKVDMDDFDDMESYNEVFSFLFDVATGVTGPKKTKGQLKQMVRDNFACWRLIFCDMANFTYDQVFNQMTLEEIEQANIALDMINAEIKRQTKNKH